MNGYKYIRAFHNKNKIQKMHMPSTVASNVAETSSLNS